MAGLLDGVDLRTQMAGQNRMELLLFRLDDQQAFGINVFKVQEVIHCPNLTHVPGSHPVVRGIAKLRGKTVPVMDLSLAIGRTPMEDVNGRFVIITEYNKRVQGFLVRAVDRIINMNWEAILPPPKGAAGGSYLTAVTQIDKHLVEIIDVEKVLSEVVSTSEQVSREVIKERDEKIEHHVLVADDSVVARNQVKRVLEQLGVECTLKNDGADALEQLRAWAREQPEGRRLSDWLALVISDIEMPKLDGYSLAKKIREDALLNDLHVILHSSLSGVFNEAMVRKVGANHFLAKYDPDELANMVQEELREHAAEHRARSGH
jgi:two-component system chemotaxis response regulator CheV